jgi:hypothetical protein
LELAAVTVNVVPEMFQAAAIGVVEWRLLPPPSVTKNKGYAVLPMMDAPFT